MGTAWLYSGYPGLINNGFGDRFEELTRQYPPESTHVSKWTGADLLKMIDILGLSDLGPFLREQEFLPDDPNEESPFGSLDAAELEEVFEDSGVPRIQIDALKVALRRDIFQSHDLLLRPTCGEWEACCSTHEVAASRSGCRIIVGCSLTLSVSGI
ncbi:unnamed protein product [Ascophyllum nodosum]